MEICLVKTEEPTKWKIKRKKKRAFLVEKKDNQEQQFWNILNLLNNWYAWLLMY